MAIGVWEARSTCKQRLFVQVLSRNTEEDAYHRNVLYEQTVWSGSVIVKDQRITVLYTHRVTRVSDFDGDLDVNHSSWSVHLSDAGVVFQLQP